MKNTVNIKNITQQELAEAVGVSRQTINFIETGRHMPSTTVPLRLPDTSASMPMKSFFSKKTTRG